MLENERVDEVWFFRLFARTGADLEIFLFCSSPTAVLAPARTTSPTTRCIFLCLGNTFLQLF